MEYEEIDDFKKIKRDYGEKMAQLCRKWFPTIMDHKGILYGILVSHFQKSKSLYWDIAREYKLSEFRDYIYEFFDFETTKAAPTNKTVKELLNSKGYEIFECKTNEEIQSFRKYYSTRGLPYIKWLSNGLPCPVGDELCTFGDMDRLADYYVFFIVKNNADVVKRDDFPERDDEYSTSVLCLQFEKGINQRVSIKSRYNHGVENPDAVYDNNLDEIAKGLTIAFERDYGFKNVSDFSTDFELENYVQANNGKHYKYNNFVNGIHYCPNNIIIDNGEVVERYKDKSRYTFMDYFILDEVEKKVLLYDVTLKDSFIDGLTGITNIQITNKAGYKEILLTLEGEKQAIIKVDKDGKLIGYENDHLISVGNSFLRYTSDLTELKLDHLEKCGDYFLNDSKSLKKLDLSNIRNVGHYFASACKSLSEVSMPKLEECGFYFLLTTAIENVSFPNLAACEGDFCGQCINIKSVSLPGLMLCGSNFMISAFELETISMPSLRVAGDYFLCSSSLISKAEFPVLKECGQWFMKDAKDLEVADFPQLEKCALGFLESLTEPVELNIPKLDKAYYKYVAILLSRMLDPNYDPENSKDGGVNVKTNNNRK